MTRDEISALFWAAHKRSGGDYAAAAEAVFAAGRASTESRFRPRLLTDKEKWIIRRAHSFVSSVADRNGIDAETLVMKFEKGPQANTTARDEAAWLLRSEHFTFQEIATAINRKDHTSAMDGCARTEARIAERPGLRDELLALVEARMALRSVG